jgi:hypothetical protein
MSASIMPRAVTVAFGTALALRVVLGAVPAEATTLPVVAPGDPIAGLFTLDPSTPLSPFTNPPSVYSWSASLGTMVVALAGHIFASQITLVFRENPPLVPAPFLPFWQLDTALTGTVDGEAVPRLTMQLDIEDHTGSGLNSLFPPPFTANLPDFDFQIQASICLTPATHPPIGCEIDFYFAALTSLV